MGILLLTSACCPEPPNLQQYETQVAGRIYNTLTAIAPTITLTPLPTATSTPTPRPTRTPTPIPQATVKATTLYLRQGPAASYPTLQTLKKGDRVDITGQYAKCAWLKVTTVTGGEGWVTGDAASLDYTEPCGSIPHGSFRPVNGAIILDKRSRKGLGQLKIENGMEQDGLVVVLDGEDRPVIAVYVWSKSQFNLTGIGDGKYRLVFVLGKDWDGDDNKFLKLESARRFNDEFAFTTTGAVFSVWSISLQPVIGGTGQSRPIPVEELPIIK